MRDIPAFTLSSGIGSLILSQIPYTQTAYIRVHSAQEGEAFIQECTQFCRSAGAEKIFVTGHSVCEQYPYHTAIIQMQAEKSLVGISDASVFPVTEKTVALWRQIYNEKAAKVHNSRWLSISDESEILNNWKAYFVHRNGELLGIGKVSANSLDWIAAMVPGAGEDVLKALVNIIPSDTVSLDVASTNTKAFKLYTDAGFIPVKTVSQWYRVL